MKRPKGPLVCWTERQLHGDRVRLVHMRQQLEGAHSESAEIVATLYDDWRERPGQQQVRLLNALRAYLITVLSRRPAVVVQVRVLKRAQALFLVELALAARSDELQRRRGLYLPVYLPEADAAVAVHQHHRAYVRWEARMRAVNEAME